jgi:amino acid adenylation domain-containing protein
VSPARNLVDYLDRAATQFGTRTALVDSNGRAVTYGELQKQSDALAGFLVSRGVARGDRVAVVIPKGIPSVVSLFGVMKAGAAYVPVDWTAPAERGQKILADCQVAACIVDPRALGVRPAASDSTLITVTTEAPAVDDPGAGTTPWQEAIQATHRSDRRPDPQDLAYVLYTSGSTGLPKGVMISQANALSFVEWCSSEFQLTEEDRVTSNAPFHFDLSVLDLYTTVKHGATLYLISEELGRSSHELARFAADHRLTVWTSTPSVLMLLTQYGELPTYDWSSLRLVMFGGEVFPIGQLRDLRRQWPRPTFYNLYGPTEITTACTFARLPASIPDDRDVPYAIGRPCPHCRALLLDEDGREVASGAEGVLYISGPSVFAGYWNRPAENAGAFVERDGVRWYKTGDVVRWDPSEGYHYVGRIDRMVKRRGFRIELGEIESAIYSHPGVSEAAVVSFDDRERALRIAAFVVGKGSDRLSSVRLKTHCAGKLPLYMIPDRFVLQDKLPRTSTDKIDYQELRRAAQSASGAA